jgi:hypothetical protein
MHYDDVPRGQWRTRGNSVIAIKDMSDDHLTRAIATLEKLAPEAARRAAMQMDAYGSEHDSMGGHAAEQEARRLYDRADGDDSAFDTELADEMFPKYAELVRERERREKAARR